MITKELTDSEKKFAFHARTMMMLNLNSNYGLKKNCPGCKENNYLDSQEHLLVFEKLLSANSVVMEISAFSDFLEIISKNKLMF